MMDGLQVEVLQKESTATDLCIKYKKMKIEFLLEKQERDQLKHEADMRLIALQTKYLEMKMKNM